MARKSKTVLVYDAGDSLRIEHYTNGPHLEGGVFSYKITPSRIRKIIQKLMPYAEWTPEIYRPKEEPHA